MLMTIVVSFLFVLIGMRCDQLKDDATAIKNGLQTSVNGTLLLANMKIQQITKKDFPKGCCLNVRFINLNNNNINHIEDGVFEHFPHLVRVGLSDNFIKKFPNLKATKLQRIDLQHNHITDVNKKAMDYYKSLWHLDLRWNKITHIKSGTFEENRELIYLNFGHNPLKKIDEYGLPSSLENLHLDDTDLDELPSEQGIKNLKRLSIKNVPNLFTIPDSKKFEKLFRIDVTYNMHCCAFQQRNMEKIISFQSEGNRNSSCNSTIGEHKNINPNFQANKTTDNTTKTSDDTDSEMFTDDALQQYLNEIFGLDVEETPLKYKCDFGDKYSQVPIQVKCSPKPDAFNPCQDVLGMTALRVFSWLISIFAVLGNLFKLIILFYSRQELISYKLMMCNLGFANLMIGMYLLALCCVDAYTHGKYYHYTPMWKYGGGCQTFGFIAIFATQLCLCTLVLITIEHLFRILFVSKTNNQMNLNHVKIAIAMIWLYSFIVAMLPVTGKVSSYSKIAICLPVDIPNKVAIGYIIWLLLAYIIGFVIIAVCYVKIYISISKSRPGQQENTINNNNVPVSKHIAMIILSNFLCWLPIIIAGFIAMYSGLYLNVEVAKFLLVVIFSINACINPFMYIIFTKVFRDDTLNKNLAHETQLIEIKPTVDTY